MDAIIIQTATATEADAERIADALLEQRLAACVQIAPVRSRYLWKGAVERADEQLLTIKTRSGLFEAVRVLIRGLHPYETPEITAVAMVDGDPDYLAWITESTTSK